ncbi:MAG TPA: Pls/PosA family non-ribosomal peptide synthetase [Nocardioidaceae bacterium]|nr:Pls/PosA family non-ribosomal peptide synthetase [Nocardioidaceae bacterium]
MSLEIAASTQPAVEHRLAELLTSLVADQRVDPDSHFFDDLGADSLVMAHFCARIRKDADLPAVSIKQVYRHPTIRDLAAEVARDGDPAVVSDRPETTTIPQATPAAPPIRTWQYVLCGALQLLLLVSAAVGLALVVAGGYEWMSAGSGVVDVYLRAVGFGAITFVGLSVLPILAKWALIGRWRSGRVRLWSLAYVRFWLVATLVRTSPLVLFAGTPLYPLYLRALGAKVGRGVAIFSRNVPVCTDLLTIGDGAVIRPAAYFGCYRARAGEIEIGAVSLGAGSFVGEASVLDIDTSLGDRAQLAHASSLHAGQAVAAGEHRNGSPAEPTDVDYGRVDPARCGAVRRVGYSMAQLVKIVLLQLPIAIGGLTLLIEGVPRLRGLIGSGPLALTSRALYWDALIGSAVLFFGGALVGLLVVITIPRLLQLAIRPGRVYPLYGLHYGLHRAVARLTNVRFFGVLFGDSAAIVPYLRGVGYDLTPVEQTGSNFGLDTRHDNPYLCSVGTGTIVADGLAMLNADYSSTSFRLSRARIGSRNFLGNNIVYPAQGRTGDDCLLATKVLVPVDGAVREGVGLLGSPSFEIPRTVQRDRQFDHLRTGPEFRLRLAAKTRHNVRTMALVLLVQWIFVVALTIIGLTAADLYDSLGAAAIAGASLAALVFGLGYSVLVERASTGFRSLRPRYCSIYDPYFWWHERYWKLSTEPPRLLNGTPFKGMVWRLLGVRIGARVFDDGCLMIEKTLVAIGDDCVLNTGSIVQPHSQEDGSFKSDRVSIGAGCTVGVGALVHYGVAIDDGAVIAPDSFVMKGADIPAHTHWGGNPARELEGSSR